jgi:hypothetical protein
LEKRKRIPHFNPTTKLTKTIAQPLDLEFTVGTDTPFGPSEPEFDAAVVYCTMTDIDIGSCCNHNRPYRVSKTVWHPYKCRRIKYLEEVWCRRRTFGFCAQR